MLLILKNQPFQLFPLSHCSKFFHIIFLHLKAFKALSFCLSVLYWGNWCFFFFFEFLPQRKLDFIFLSYLLACLACFAWLLHESLHPIFTIVLTLAINAYSRLLPPLPLVPTYLFPLTSAIVACSYLLAPTYTTTKGVFVHQLISLDFECIHRFSEWGLVNYTHIL